jgi:glycosyltransferase involved in cell wall biosynthesis
MKVVVLGPDSLHYKGGIAQFTTRLCDELALTSEVTHESWSRMYPTFLTKREFRDDVSQVKTGRILSTNLLDYINPLSWFRFIHRTVKSAPDKILITWIHPVHSPVYLVFLIGLRVFSRAQISLICHNVFPHETIPLQSVLTSPIFKLVHRVIVHGSSETDLAATMKSRDRIKTLYHPIFDIFQTQISTKKDSGKTLHLLFFGAIRAYKGLEILLPAVRELIDSGERIHLHIAGEPFDGDSEVISSQIAQYTLQDFVTTRLEYIPNEDIASLFMSCDVAVYPYLSATQSGSLAMAYAFSVPVIATRVGGLSDVVIDGTSGYLTEPDVKGIGSAIRRFIEKPISNESVYSFATKNLSWSRYANEVLN